MIYTARVGYWYVAGQIIIGFVSFGSLHIHTTRLEPWHGTNRLMIITGTLTLITALSFLLPDNAWFLTQDERAKRFDENQTGVENKHFKKDNVALRVVCGLQ
ncbi:hypothetical protein BJV77DRAFT_1006935 [Russula vinacea]|nr:hypothetical protein BJV77DRAFT_1006935 [Russula vinacea]